MATGRCSVRRAGRRERSTALLRQGARGCQRRRHHSVGRDPNKTIQKKGVAGADSLIGRGARIGSFPRQRFRGVRLELHDLGDSGGTATPAPITGIRLFFGNQNTADHRGLSCCFGCRESHSVPFKGHRPPCPQWADRLPDCLTGVRMRGDVSQSGHRRLDKGGGTEDWLGLIDWCVCPSQRIRTVPWPVTDRRGSVCRRSGQLHQPERTHRSSNLGAVWCRVEGTESTLFLLESFERHRVVVGQPNVSRRVPSVCFRWNRTVFCLGRWHPHPGQVRPGVVRWLRCCLPSGQWEEERERGP